MAKLIKTQFVMNLKREGKDVSHFVCIEEGDDLPSAFKDSYMPNKNFADLRKPQTITVTIEPGDTLNAKKGK